MELQTSELGTTTYRLRQTLVHNPHGMDIVISTANVSDKEHYPFETGIFYTLDGGETFDGEIEADRTIIRGEDIQEAANNHVYAIMSAARHIRRSMERV